MLDLAAPAVAVESPATPARRRRVTVVAAYLPYPARRNGLSLRYFPILEYLARRHELQLLVVRPVGCDDTVDAPADAPAWARAALRVDVPGCRRTARKVKTLLLCALRDAAPPRHVVYELATARTRVANVLAGTDPEVVLWVGPQLLELGRSLRPLFPEVRWVLDLVDSPSLYLQREPRVLERSLRGVGARWELARTRSFERAVRAAADAAIYISDADARAATGPGRGPPPVVIPNGVLADAPPVIGLPGASAAPTIGFLGHMGYDPNVRAALRLHEHVWQPLQAGRPELRLKIVGRDPLPEIRALAAKTVEVTGAVDCIWSAMRDVAVFVFPIDTGAGLQNKILEALWARKPVVTTPACAAAVGALPGRDLLVATDPEGLRRATARVLDDRALAARLAAAGHAHVARNFGWEPLLERFEAALLGAE